MRDLFEKSDLSYVKATARYLAGIRRADAKEKLDIWRQDYNQNRPHSSLGNLAPATFSAAALGQDKHRKNSLANAKS